MLLAGITFDISLLSCSPVLLFSCSPVLLFSCSPVLLFSFSPFLLFSCSPVLLFSCSDSFRGPVGEAEPLHLLATHLIHDLTARAELQSAHPGLTRLG